MAKPTSVNLGLVVLCMTLLSALTTANPTASDGLDSTTVTKTASAVLMPRGGTADGLPDNGKGPTPSSGHEPGGPYDYGDYWYYCGNFVTGEREDLYTGEGEFTDDPWRDYCWAPANGCLRLFCLETSAIWLCNDNDYAIELSCYDVGYFAKRIREACCPDAGISGQMFHPTDNYNVVIGYGNCNHDILTPPYTSGKGNNYACDDDGGGFY